MKLREMFGRVKANDVLDAGAKHQRLGRLWGMVVVRGQGANGGTLRVGFLVLCASLHALQEQLQSLRTPYCISTRSTYWDY